MSVLNYLKNLKSITTDESFKTIVAMVEADIKFNNIRFGKTTSQADFISRCKLCHIALVKC